MCLVKLLQLEKDLDQLKAVLEDGSAGREAAEEMRRVKETELEEVKVRTSYPVRAWR